MIPCDGCICLPICINKYKKYKKDDYMYPAEELAYTICESKLKPIYMKSNNYDKDGKGIKNHIDIWWEDNYG